MNVNDAEVDNPAKGQSLQDAMQTMLEAQKQLHKGYLKIEKPLGLGLLPDTISIHDQRVQYVIKDFFWRSVEERAEAAEAKDPAHKKEELIDELSFLLEVYCILGYAIEIHLPEKGDSTYYLGLAANCLKNKPWKQTKMITDELKFWELLTKATSAMFVRHFNSFSDVDEYTGYYFKKHAVNLFRQRSNY